MNIEIITTPNEDLKESGFGTIKACNDILETTILLGHNTTLNICKTKKDLYEVVLRKPDLVILAVKYLSFENEDDVWLSDYFSKNNINYTGSSREVLKFDSDKVRAKLHLKNIGIRTANFFTAIPDQYKSAKDLPLSFPLFLKPRDAANGNGIDDLSLVTTFTEFKSKVLSLYKSFAVPILVEKYLDGREFTVAVIKTTHGEIIASPIEIVPMFSTNGLRILGEQAKIDNLEELKKIEDKAMITTLKKLAIDVFKNLGIRDFARIDMKTDSSGYCFFMEANLVPGMKMGSSYFPKAHEIESNLNYEEVIELMLSEGLNRCNTIMRINNNVILNDNTTLTNAINF